jgi:ABC-2 type transport system permease protein
MILHIAAHELRRLFLSPLAWSVLAVEQLILAYFFLIGIDNYMTLQPRLVMMQGAPGITDLVVAPLFGQASIFLLFAVPMLTMRLISEERRGQTLSLLLSAPVSMTQIVVGKFLGVTAFILVLVLMVALMPLSLLVGGHLDFGMFAAALLGVVLLTASFIAVGLFMSTLTAQPAIAAVSTFGVLLGLWIIDWVGAGRSGDYGGLLGYLSILRHYASLLKGMFNSGDVIYYLLFITTFIVLSIRRLDADRLQH